MFREITKFPLVATNRRTHSRVSQEKEKVINGCPVMDKEPKNSNQQTIQQPLSEKLLKRIAKSNTRSTISNNSNINSNHRNGTSPKEKQLHVGNLSGNVTLEDIYSLFDLKMTAQLRATCSINLPLNGKNIQRLCFYKIDRPRT